MNHAQRLDLAASVAAGEEDLLHAQVVRDRDHLTQLNDAAQTLSGYRDMVAMARDSHEPISNTTARLVQLGVSDVCRRIGLSDDVVSTESEEGTMQISLEAISDRLKKIWEGVKVALARLSESLSKLFARFLDSAQKTQEKAQNIEAELGNGTKGADEPIEIDLGNLVVGSGVPGNFPSLAVDIIQGIGSYVVDDNAAAKFLDNVIQVIRNSPVDNINSSENANVINAFAADVGKRLQAIKGGGTANYPAYGDQVVMSTGQLLGNSAIVCVYSKPGSTMVNTLQQFRVLEWREQRPNNLPKSIVPLTAEQIKPILAAVKKASGDISGISSYLEQLRGYTGKMVELGDSIVSKAPEDKQSEIVLPLSQLSALVGSVTSSFDVAIKYHYRLSGTLLTLCQKSLA